MPGSRAARVSPPRTPLAHLSPRQGSAILLADPRCERLAEGGEDLAEEMVLHVVSRPERGVLLHLPYRLAPHTRALGDQCQRRRAALLLMVRYTSMYSSCRSVGRQMLLRYASDCTREGIRPPRPSPARARRADRSRRQCGGSDAQHFIDVRRANGGDLRRLEPTARPRSSRSIAPMLAAH